jgi:hypothetical protein
MPGHLMSRSTAVVLATRCALLTLFSACVPQPPSGRLACSSARDCPDGWFCHGDDRCYPQAMTTSLDAGTDAWMPPDLRSITPGESGPDSGSMPVAAARDGGEQPTASSRDAGPALDAERAGSGGRTADESGAGASAAGSGGTAIIDAGMPAQPPVTTIDVGAYGCLEPNTLCARSAECIMDRCLIVVCESAGILCDGPAECCDLACNGHVCKCGMHSTTCGSAAAPCCDGLYCETGQCATCQPANAACGGAYQCCGVTDCYNGTCQCRPNGAACDERSVCCAGTRCDGGQCQCRALGAACDASSVCCSGAVCKDGLCTTPTTTTIPKVPISSTVLKNTNFFLKAICSGMNVGDVCATASDCCSQNCFDGQCVKACAKVGEVADVDTQCCSRLRADGKCAYANCVPAAATCTANQNCCSDSCVQGKCAGSP